MLILCLSLLQFAMCDNWAVLVAGSRGFGNYRHQADVCRAYHIASNNGIPDEHIITMFYDDVANNQRNPFPGELFNTPTPKGTPGLDVYKDCKKDYTGHEVTPRNFLSVLTGDKVGSRGKPVLESTTNDDVFVNFVDHGGAGIIAFPTQVLDAKPLIDALKKAHAKGLFKRMVFYLEACESGSMFEKILPANISVYATTASNMSESSWGTFCPPNDKVNGVELGTCLGDLYSVNWMANAERAGEQESLERQYKFVKSVTNKSHVMQYGNISWTSEEIGDFMGGLSPMIFPDERALPSPSPPSSEGQQGLVDSRLIQLHLAYWRYLRLEQSSFIIDNIPLMKRAHARQRAGRDLIRAIAHQLRVDRFFVALASVATQHQAAASKLLASTPHPHAFATTGSLHCIARLRRRMGARCGIDFTDSYTMQYHRVLANLCQDATSRHAMTIVVLSHLRRMCR